MIFNSSEFLIFLPIVFGLYWGLRSAGYRYQNILLLIASYTFYGWWDWRFLSLIATSTVTDYLLGLSIHDESNPRRKRLFLLLSLILNLGLLGFFKYFNFFVDSLKQALLMLGMDVNFMTLEIILPVGISFYTFQTLSYSIDIYYGKIKPTRDFIGFSTFVCFFPQLVAGPIERASNLLPQFLKARKFDLDQAIQGVSLIVYGMFKKVLIADRLAIYVDSVFGDIGNANTISAVLGIIFFSFQIYCDFSGYSLIARGTAKLLGFELMINFRRPYLASNIADFWRRWHISLSTWFRDYIYIPLGGKRVSTGRNYYNLVVVFLVSGLWHGANWTFVIWGGLHGIFQVIYVSYSKFVPFKNKNTWWVHWANVLLVYVLVCFAWIFFRAKSLEEALAYISKITEGNFSLNLTQITALEGPVNFAISFLAIGLLFLSYRLPEHLNFKKQVHHIAFSVIALLLIFILGVNGNATFIYFQF
ncbi:MAG: MBOAT family protein [Bacteroidota bacterium]